MPSEVVELAEEFDMAYTVKCGVHSILMQAITLTKITDSLSLFDTLTKASVATRRCPNIDLKTVKDL